METHKSLDADIDDSLIKNIFNSEKKRQIISLMYLIHEDLFFGLNVTESVKDHIRDLVNLFEIDISEQSDQISISDRNLLENLWNYHLFTNTRDTDLDKYLHSSRVKKIREIFTFFKDENENLNRYYFDMEELAIVLGSFFKEWGYKKLLLKNQAFELEHLRCRRYSVIHKIINIHNIDDVDLLYFPNDTFNAIKALNLVIKPLFFAETILHEIIDNIGNNLNEIQTFIVKIFPYYFKNTRKMEGIVEKIHFKQKKEDIMKFILENEDKFDEDLIDMIYPISNRPFFIGRVHGNEPDQSSQDYMDYMINLNKILKLFLKIKSLKEKVEKEYNTYFSDNSRMEYTDFLDQLGIDGARQYQIKINDLLAEYESNVAIFKNLELDKIEIAYHKFSIERLMKSGRETDFNVIVSETFTAKTWSYILKYVIDNYCSYLHYGTSTISAVPTTTYTITLNESVYEVFKTTDKAEGYLTRIKPNNEVYWDQSTDSSRTVNPDADPIKLGVRD